MRFLALLLVFLVLASVPTCGQSGEYMGLQWNASAKEVISDLDAGDVNGDGKLEVAVSGSSDGLAYLFDYKGEMVWKRDVGAYVNAIAVGDINGDGKSDVVVGHADLYVFDGKGNRTLTWNTQNPVYQIRAADLNGDGAEDIVLLSYSKDECRDSAILVVDGKTKTELWRYVIGKDFPSDLEVADANGDGKREVVVGIIYRSRGSTKAASCQRIIDRPAAVYMLSSEGALLWQYETAGGVTSVAVGDLDGDRKGEIVAGGYMAVYAIRSDGSLMWRNDNIVTNYVDDVAVADLDGDNRSEVLVASNEVYALDRDGKVLWTGLTDSRTYVLATGDLDGSGQPKVIAGSGSLYVFDRKGSQLWRSPSHTSYGIVKAADLDGNGYDEVVTGSVKAVFVYRTLNLAKRLRADQLYDDALRKSAGNIPAAIEELNDARRIYSELGLIGKVSDCVNEIRRLSNVSGRVEDLKVEADEALNRSRDFAAVGDYINASRYAQSCLSGYYQSPSLNKGAIEECNSILSLAKEKIALSAAEELLKANESYYAKDYGSALQHADKAYEYYSFIGDMERAEKSSILADELRGILGLRGGNETKGGFDVAPYIDKLKNAEPVYFLLLAGFIVAASILTVVSIYFWRFGVRKRLDVDRLHKVTYGDGEYDPQGGFTHFRVNHRGEEYENKEMIRDMPEMHETAPLPARKRQFTVERYRTVDEAGADGDLKIVEPAAKRRQPIVQRYATTVEANGGEKGRRYGDARMRRQPAVRGYEMDVQRQGGRELAGEDFKVEETKKRGIFKTKDCRAGVCVSSANSGAGKQRTRRL